jgi:glycosyltransferase involved in cell wall biosynthesis
MKKLLFIVNVDWFFISHRLPIAITAIQKGFEVHIACAITTKKAALESLGIVVHPLKMSRSGVNVISEIRSFVQIFDAVTNVRPDIVHTVTIKPVLYGNIVARLLKVPVRVASISGLGYVFIASGFKAKIFRALISTMYRVALSDAKAIIFQNKHDRDILKKMGAVNPSQEVFIRGSGVDLNEYAVVNEPKDVPPVVMLVARLLVDKGVNEFVAAASILKHLRPDIRMVLVGDIDSGNPKSITSEQLKSWIDNNVIEHWGYSYNVSKTMAQSNIVVLPSYREGLPKSLIEAAACGRAVVTTDVPGCRDAIEPGKTGLLVRVKTDKPLADAILKLIDDESLRHQFAIRAREFAEITFSINDVIDTHLTLYNQT